MMGDRMETTERENECPGCGAQLESEDCYRCHGDGGFDLHDVSDIEYAPGEWQDCEQCCGTGTIVWCPTDNCPGNLAKPAQSYGLFQINTTVPVVVSRQSDPGARARRAKRKVQRQNRLAGRR